MVAGNLVLDITPRFPAADKFDFGRMFSPGKLIHVGEAVLSTGGAVSNTGLAMAKLGVEVILNSKVGDDNFGEILTGLIGNRAAARIKKVSERPTPYTLVIAPPDVDRIFLHAPGTSDTFGADDVDYEAAGSCDLFHFGYPPVMKRMYENDGEELAEIFRRIKDMGLTTSLDMALPDPSSSAGEANWRKILANALPCVDIFLPSIEEITFMLDRDLFEKRCTEAKGRDPVLFYEPRDCQAIADKLLSMGVKTVLLKMGIRGCYLRTAQEAKMSDVGRASLPKVAPWSNRELWAASLRADSFVSAVGAGDATIAGFLCGFIRGFSPEDCLNIASIVGWQNVQRLDTLSGIEDWPKTLKLLGDKTMPRNPAGLQDSTWDFCAQRQAYSGPNDQKASRLK